jgi:hypothetical protein
VSLPALPKDIPVLCECSHHFMFLLRSFCLVFGDIGWAFVLDAGDGEFLLCLGFRGREKSYSQVSSIEETCMTMRQALPLEIRVVVLGIKCSKTTKFED